VMETRFLTVEPKATGPSGVNIIVCTPD